MTEPIAVDVLPKPIPAPVAVLTPRPVVAPPPAAIKVEKPEPPKPATKPPEAEKPADAPKATVAATPSTGLLGKLAARFTKKQAAVGASALFSLVAGIAGVRMMFPSDEAESIPTAKASQPLGTEPKAPFKPAVVTDQPKVEERISIPVVALPTSVAERLPPLVPWCSYAGECVHFRVEKTFPFLPAPAPSILPAMPFLPALPVGQPPLVAAPSGFPAVQIGFKEPDKSTVPPLPLPTPAPVAIPPAGLPGTIPAETPPLFPPPKVDPPVVLPMLPAVPMPKFDTLPSPKLDPPVSVLPAAKGDQPLTPVPPPKELVDPKPLIPGVAPMTELLPPKVDLMPTPPVKLVPVISPLGSPPVVPALPDFNPLGSGTKIDLVKPANSPSVLPAAAVERTASTSYDVDIYHPKTGDSYESISKDFYNDARYAAALRAYNQNKAIQGATVDVPPLHIVKKLAPGGNPAPAARQPEPGWGAAPATVGAPVRNGGDKTFRIPTGGMTMKAVAKLTLNDENRWRDIFALNPQLRADESIPAGTILKMPADSRNP